MNSHMNVAIICFVINGLVWSSTDFAGSMEGPQAKRRKIEAEEGEKAISTFLSSVRELASSGKSDCDIAVKLEELKLDFLNMDNSYIKSILNVGSQ